MTGSSLTALFFLLAVLSKGQDREQGYANAYRSICSRYLALVQRLSAEEITFPKGASRKVKLAVVAVRQESDASRLKKIADSLRKLHPPRRFVTLQVKTQTFLDLNVSQPLAQAIILRRMIATGKRIDTHALADRQDRTLNGSAASIRAEALRLGFKTALP